MLGPNENQSHSSLPKHFLPFLSSSFSSFFSAEGDAGGGLLRATAPCLRPSGSCGLLRTKKTQLGGAGAGGEEKGQALARAGGGSAVHGAGRLPLLIKGALQKLHPFPKRGTNSFISSSPLGVRLGKSVSVPGTFSIKDYSPGQFGGSDGWISSSPCCQLRGRRLFEAGVGS